MNRFQFDLLLALVRQLDIAKNPAPEAIFDPLNQGFNIWCTPQDNPGGDWLRVADGMIAAAYTKPCEFVASAYAEWDAYILTVTALKLSTAAYALADRLPDEYVNRLRDRIGRRHSIFNRTQDTNWATGKIRWLCREAGVACPPIVIEDE